ncbi:MAG: LPS export ABC transporter periplasmic protein LptC [Pseudomonadota bacterium]
MNVYSNTGQEQQHADESAFPSAPKIQPGLEFISGQRSEKEFRNAVRHSGRVRFLKYAMPVVGIVIILALVITLVVRQFLIPDIDLGVIAVQDGKLVMENPNLNGFDRNKRPFQLSADKAIQDARQPKRVELIKISATLPIDEAVSAEIKAGNGVFDAEAKTLVLSEQVNVQTNDGMKIDLEDADVDIGEGVLKTFNPVFASSPQADISADSLEIQESGERVVFEGTVRMTLRPKQFQQKRGNDG